MRHTTMHFDCEGCGLATGGVENDLAADEADTSLPPGWVQILARRVVPNPTYVAPRTEAQIADEMAAAAGVPDGEREKAAAAFLVVASQAARTEAEMVEPTHFVDELELHYCASCVDAVLAPVAEDAFVSAGWAKASEPAPTETAEDGKDGAA